MNLSLLFISILLFPGPVQGQWFQVKDDKIQGRRSIGDAIKNPARGVDVNDLKAHLAKTRQTPPAPEPNDAFVLKKAEGGPDGTVTLTLNPKEAQSLFSKGAVELTAFPARTRSINSFNLTATRSTDPEFDLSGSRADFGWMLHDASKKVPDIRQFSSAYDLPRFGGVKVTFRSNLVEGKIDRPLIITFSDTGKEAMGSVQIRAVEFPALITEKIDPKAPLVFNPLEREPKKLQVILSPENTASLLEPGFLEIEIKQRDPRRGTKPEPYIIHILGGVETLFTFQIFPTQDEKWVLQDMSRQSPEFVHRHISVQEMPDQKTLKIQMPSSLFSSTSGKELTVGFRNDQAMHARSVSMRAFSASPSFQALEPGKSKSVQEVVYLLQADNFFVRKDATRLLRDVFRPRITQSFPADRALIEAAKIFSSGPTRDPEVNRRLGSVFRDLQERGRFQDHRLADPRRSFQDISREIRPGIDPQFIR